LRLLSVITSMNPKQGGPCQGIRNLSPEWNLLGIVNEAVCLDDPSEPFLGKDSFPIHAIGASKGPSAYNAKLFPWLLENICHYDVILVHGLWQYHGYAVRKAFNELRRRLVVTNGTEYPLPKLFVMPHGMLDPYFQKAPSRRLKAIRNLIYWKFIESKLINQADGILFTCEEELRLARLTFSNYKPKKELNVGYGIAEPTKFTPEIEQAFLDRCPSVRNRPYILFISRIHEKKGLDLLLTAYAELLQNKAEVQKGSDNLGTMDNEVNAEIKIHHPELPVLVIAGPGLDTRYGQRLRRLAAALPAGSVSFPGMLTGDAKWGAFYGCQAFVLPSHQENFGIAVAEAMACGKPVLISNQVNIWREIASSGGGLVEEDSVSGTLRLLRNWCQLNETEQNAIGELARTAYLQHFAVRAAAQKMAATITKV
jgi:glycosyltransferase involved in cell wall biosynthesis